MASTVKKIGEFEVEMDRTEELVYISDQNGRQLMSMTEKDVNWAAGFFVELIEFFDKEGWGKKDGK